MKTIKVFCLDACEHSNDLKQELWDNNIAFEEVYLGSTRAIHDLRNGGLSQARAPVLQVRERFYTGYDLFPGGVFDHSFLEQCLLDTGSLSAPVR
jgi:glutaredoxin